MGIKIGAFSVMSSAKYEHLFDNLLSLGLNWSQLQCWDTGFYEHDFDAKAACVRRQIKDSGINISALWAGYSGPIYWNFREGPVTLGLVPPAYRQKRVEELKRAADFAAAIGAPAIITHCGFLPENMTDPEFVPTRVAIAEVADYCKKLGIGFWFETGQETPVTLRRYIDAIGLDNLGINLDGANLLLYGKGNPIDALDVFGKYVRQLHVKDGMPPTDGINLGAEVQVGKGRVDYPEYVKKLQSIGFDGAYIIEREIPEGAEQSRDILETVNNLKRWAGEA